MLIYSLPNKYSLTMNQGVATTDDVLFNILNTTGSISANVTGIDLTANTLIHWNCNDNAASTVVLDSSGEYIGTLRNNAGTGINTSTVSVVGKINRAFNFDGTGNNAVFTGTFVRGMQDISISGWFLADADGTGKQIIFRTNEETDYYYSIFISATHKLSFGTAYPVEEGGGEGVILTTTTSVRDGLWHFFVITQTGELTGNTYFYLDNILEDSDNTGMNENDQVAWLGLTLGRYGINTMRFKGSIDNVALYNKVLSTAEIAFLWNGGAGTESLASGINTNGVMTSGRFISDIAVGTSPYSCISTTLNTNLNADYLDGQHGAYYAAAADYVPYTGATTQLNLGAQNFLTSGTLGAGAITGTSFIIGANTLTTSEWAFLDGQDQSVLVASTPQFARLGIGIASDAKYGLYISYSVSSSLLGTGVYGGITQTKYTPSLGKVGSIYGLNFSGKWLPSANLTANSAMDILGGVLSNAVATSLAGDTGGKSMTITKMYSYKSALDLHVGAGATGAVSATNAYSFESTNAVVVNGATIGTLYAFYDAGMTTGIVNWGLGINTANNYINGSLRIGSAVAPTVPLDITGAVLMSSTLGVTGVLTAGSADLGTSCEANAYTVGGAAGVSGTFTSVTVVNGIVTAGT